MNKRALFVPAMLAILLIFSSCGKEKTTKPHILLITVDTLRSDHLGVYGYHRETSPFIDRLAREGVVFKNAVTPLPLTAPSHASILTSLHPLTHNLTINGLKLNDRVQTLAEVLQKNGYYTIGTAAVGVMAGDKNFSQGFDSFSDKWEKEKHLNPKFPLAERTAPSVNKSLTQQIDEYCTQHRDKPLFIWVHYYDPHTPYYKKEDITFKSPIKKGDPPGVKNYDIEIRYTDRHIEMLYDYLGKKGITPRLVTCITADHGEQFGEHGYTYGHMDFYRENTQVPLIFHGKRIPKNKTIETCVSTMDIGVTLLRMAGLRFDNPTEGIDLFALIEKNGPRKERKFLIIGGPRYARSLQLLGTPYAYILNFDHHYRDWYISYNPMNQAGENLFQPLPQEKVRGKGGNIYVLMPKNREPGLNYAVLRAEIPKNDGLFIEIKVNPMLSTGKISVNPPPQGSRTLEIIYPVTILDDIRVCLYPKGNTRVENLRSAYISHTQFPADGNFTQTIVNKIYRGLKTLRKNKPANEFYDLSTDMEMKKNQAAVKNFKPIIMNFTKLIYDVFDYYDRKKDKLLSGLLEETPLSENDKKMLETLGYL